MSNKHNDFTVPQFTLRLFVSWTHHNDGEVEETPEAGEVLLVSEGDPLDEHFHGEDDSEDYVEPVEGELQLHVLVQVHIFKRLQQRCSVTNTAPFSMYIKFSMLVAVYANKSI